MKRAALVVALFIVGLTLAVALAAAAGESTGTATACATASTPAHTVAVDGVPVSTLPGDTQTRCETVTYTIPTVAQSSSSSTATTPTPPAPAGPSVAPGQSWQAAYNAAASGSTIRVLAGVHGFQKITGTKAMTFVGDAGNQVRQLIIDFPNGTFDGINVDANGQRQNIGTYSAVLENSGEPGTFKNGSIGDTLEQKGALITDGGWTFDNVRFFDVRQGGGGAHVECIQALWVPNFTLRNSTFTNCGIMGLSLGYPGWWSPLPPPYCCVVLEGNTFGPTVPSNNYSLAIWSNKNSCNDTCGWGEMTGYRIRNNFVNTLINRMTRASDTIICGNTGGVPADWKTAC